MKLAGLISDLQSLNISADMVLAIVGIVERHVISKPSTKKKGSALPSDWQPSTETTARLKKQGISQSFIDGCVEDMKDWHVANAHRAVANKSNWNATLSMWVRREWKKQSAKKPYGAQPVVIRDDNPPNQWPREQWQSTLDMYYRTGHWSRNAGPEPGQRGCLAPAEMLRQSH